MSAGEPAKPVTKLLNDWRRGDSTAFAEVTALVDKELRRLAASFLSRERTGHTLQPTALVNEAYIRLMGAGQGVDWQNRSHFIAIAARHMRHILVDHARKRRAEKRGAGAPVMHIDDASLAVEERSADLLALDEALTRLAVVDQRKAHAMELKYFGGLEMAEIAEALGISIKTVEKDVRMASAWLRASMSR